jgi:hypothetical protein
MPGFGVLAQSPLEAMAIVYLLAVLACLGVALLIPTAFGFVLHYVGMARERRMRTVYRGDATGSISTMEGLPIAFVYNRADWWRILLEFVGILVGSVFLGNLLLGNGVRQAFSSALWIGLVATWLLWLWGRLAYGESYIVAQDGVVIRQDGSEPERIPWSEITEIQRWPVVLITRSGKRISIRLPGATMSRAQKVVLEAYTAERKPA